MNDPVFVLDTQNIIVDINPAGQKVLNQSADQIIGKHAREVLKGQADLLDRFRNSMNAREEIAIDENSQVRFYELSISPLVNRQCKTIGRAIVLHDISDRKQAEATMTEARDQALQASQMKSQFLARMSHELRTPLVVIRGYADALNEPAYGTLTEPQAKAVKEIIESNQRVSDMVGELLDEARLAAGAVQLESRVFAPVGILEDVEAKLSILTQKKGISLTTELDPELPAQLVGDPTRINQMVTNLTSNSIKFTKQGGVHIRFYLISKEQWAMDVTDTGPGIPKAAHESIFEPFRQADNTITRKHGGTGLGLSIVKHLTGLMGGEITLKSKLGSGTAFTIVLPLNTEVPE
jgi:polar amino acid transport system substrate-binding protein